MATVLHGACNSPRQQHHQCELTAGAPGCLTGSQHQHSHQSNAPVYSSISKYLRPHTAPQLHGHPHIYDGNGSNANPAQLQYGTTLNQISYIPMSTVVSHPSPTIQHGYGSAQLSSASPVVPSSVDAYRNYWSHTHAATLTYGSGGNGRGNSKRKTAVQLLAETKPFYMKTDTNVSMVDRLPVAAAPPSPGYRKTFMPTTSLKRGRSSASASGREQGKYNSSYAGTPLAHGSGELERRFLPRPPNGRDISSIHNVQHTHHHHHHNHHAQINRHSAPSYNNNMLQTKLKLLLAPTDSSRDRDRDRDRSVPMSTHGSDMSRKFDFSPSIGAENCSGEASLPYMRKEDIVAIPPPMFLSTQSYDDSYSYAGGDSSSIDDPLVLTDDYRPISPPAEYAAETTHTNPDNRGRYNYQRSYSHSHEMTGDNSKYDADTFNINSHKSLPDLHSQISRHSPHSEILSCCSRGNRSNKSAGESSLNRDSGGSSGHYTHRSEPCYRQREAERDNYDSGKTTVCCNHAGNAAPIEIRRDSGSSTQHSANSYCGYASPAMYGGRMAAECVACRCSRNVPSYDASCDYLLNFPTPVVPEAFQDDYTPPSPSVLLPQTQSQARVKIGEQRYYNSSMSGESRQHQQQQQQQVYNQTTSQSQNHSTIRLPPNPCNVQSPGSTPSIEDISPPPIEFKRQKCIRLKNRNRLPVPNVTQIHNNGSSVNGSAPVAGYGHGEAQSFLFPKCISTNSEDYSRAKSSFGNNSRRSSCERVMMPPVVVAMPPTCPSEMEQAYSNYGRDNDELSDLENFFDRMGLNDEKFNEIYTAPRRRRSTTTDSDDSSTVFFSDVSTVDSMRLPDSTETQQQTTQPYRPSEPPSIVERNARIIKWLCNIRKLEHNIKP